METEKKKKVAEGNFQVAIPTGTNVNFQVAANHNFRKRRHESSVTFVFTMASPITKFYIQPPNAARPRLGNLS